MTAPKDWPASKVELRPVASLIPFARNSRTHAPAQVDMIAASIREWGWTTPILVAEDSTIIAGHARALAAGKLGLTEVPVMVARGWSEAQKRAYVIADNQLPMQAGWDLGLLKVEIGDLAGLDFSLDLLGFDDQQLSALLADDPAPGLTDPDEAPEPQVDPVSLPGDIWILGRHRLICGDSTSADTVAAVLAGVIPHLMVTDPPYGVSYDPSARRALQSKGSTAATGTVMNDDRSDWQEAWALFPGDVTYVWHGERQLVGVADQLQRAGFDLRNLIVWGKGGFVVGRGNYHSQHETCWYAVRRGATGHWAGDRKQTTLWQIDRPKKSETGHATQKPVECMRRPIENNSNPGQAVYEPFAGSGTTIIAAEMTGRVCYAVELNPAYVDVAVRRWQDFTGKAATLDGTGEPFEAIMAIRPRAQ